MKKIKIGREKYTKEEVFDEISSAREQLIHDVDRVVFPQLCEYYGVEEDDKTFNELYCEWTDNNEIEEKNEKKLKYLQLIVGVLNNYLDDEDFIERVYDYNKNNYDPTEDGDESYVEFFENAEYDTIRRCEYYIATFLNVIPEAEGVYNYLIKT